MKKVFLIGILIALVNVAMCQVSSTVRDLNVTGGFKIGAKSVIGISTDTTFGTRRDNFLATEKMVKEAIERRAVTGAGGTGGVSSVFGRTGAVTANSGDYTVGQISGAAPSASPTLTGFPAAPTQSTGTNNTTLATTAFVQNSLSAQSKDTLFVSTASQNVLQVVTAAGKDSLGFKQQTANKFLASGISGTTDITARAIVAADIPTLNQNTTGNAATVTNGVYTTGAGTVYLTPTGSASGLTGFPTFNQNTTGNAATVTNGVYTTGAGTVYLTPNGSASALTGFPILNQNTTGTAANVTGIVAVANGGTNITSYTTGDFPYASATNTLGKLAIGSTGQVLTVAGGVPTWAAAGGGSAWGLTGNSITAGSNFLGSTNNISVRFRRNNIEAMVIDSATGNVGMNTSASSTIGLRVNSAIYGNSQGGGGVAYWLGNGDAFRGTAGASNLYFDGNTTLTGTINFRSTTVAVTGDLSVGGNVTSGSNITSVGNYITSSGTATNRLINTTASRTWYFENFRNSASGSLEIADNINSAAVRAIVISPTTFKVGINTINADPSAQLDVVSTTAGFLPPRMTNTQKTTIATPATGLTVYCTDCTATDTSTGVMQTYNGTNWKNNW